MEFNLIDYKNGIHAFDAGYVRHQLAAIHLSVDDGRVAFIDNGSNTSLPRSLRALAALGLTPDCVDYVMVTHIHLDHAGGSGAMMQAFPQARFVVHPRGARHMIDPTKLMAATEAVYGRDNARQLYGELIPVPADRVIETSDGMVLPLGQRELAIYDAPGHAKHHVFIHDRAANGIFTGDTFGISYRECDVAGRPLLMPSTTPSQFDPVDLRDSVERMIALEPEAVYLTHFTRIAPPRPLAETMLRRLDDFVGIALRAKHAGGDVLASIRSAMAAYFLAEAQAHGMTLPDAEILAIWQMDIDLDAQGLAIWAGATAQG